ncbi:patatin-like phospholipase family protein [Rhizobium leguminosarum]|uniref:patatin-like phospholipase family protein n=1 Tax=Rhizobium leguminosarum TaxID=384 RepID=UPI003F95CEDD
MKSNFDEVFSSELQAVHFRRNVVNQGLLIQRRSDPYGSVPPVDVEPSDDLTSISADLRGLTLSGGGNRSAAFSLGVTQALDSLRPDDEDQVVDAFDYISSVSGGGYMATSIVSGLMQAPYTYPFASKLDSAETDETKHLRDYSNFLTPNGLIDYLTSFSLVLRGLLVNLTIALPLVLLLAVFTAACQPTVESLTKPDFFGIPLENLPFPIANFSALKGFTLTTNLIFLAAVLIFASALFTSITFRTGTLTGRSRLSLWLGVLVAVILVSAFSEVQPLIIAGMFFASGSSGTLPADTNTMLTSIGKIIPTLAAVLVPVAGLLIATAQKLANIVKAAVGEDTWKAAIQKRASLIALYASALIVPGLFWVAYLYLAYWAIGGGPSGLNPNAPSWIRAIPESRLYTSLPVIGFLGPIASAYFWTALFLVVICLFVGPNSNSLHQLYRDRLATAFLFSRSDAGNDDFEADAGNWNFSSLKRFDSSPGEDCRRKWRFGASFSPYLLVNTAINLAGSKEMNRRGRNADNFIFSPLFVGSETTGYSKTTDLEHVANVSLATAMATSGAAASANMGNHTIRILTFSLSMLNVRLGYWLANPNRLEMFSNWTTKLRANVGTWYFATEASGRMTESRLNVYLTDGGHVENLGIYELLRRRCKVIVAIDAEADPGMTFESFVKLQIISRIDMGIRIDLPWKKISKHALEVSQSICKGNEVANAKGPHGAVGIIHYGPEEYGLIFYIKSSMSGDENDYVMDYKVRNPTYPHESTLDQFFSEEQFEVYRALGFHAARGFFSGADNVAQPDEHPPHWPVIVRDGLRQLNIPDEMCSAFIERLDG